MKILASFVFAFTMLLGTHSAFAACDASLANSERLKAENAARVKAYPLAHAEGKMAGLDFEDCRDSTTDPVGIAKSNLLAGYSFAIAAISIHRYGDQEGDAGALAHEARRDLKAYLSSGHTDKDGRASADNWLQGLDSEGL